VEVQLFAIKPFQRIY